LEIQDDPFDPSHANRFAHCRRSDSHHAAALNFIVAIYLIIIGIIGLGLIK